jgi:hypothetical protein
MYHKESYESYQTWRRVVFPISKCNGRVNQQYFKEELLYNKTSTQDIKFVFMLLEMKTNKFSNIRLCFKVKILFIILMLVCVVCSVVSFVVLGLIVLGVCLLIVGVLFFGVFCFCVMNVFKNIFKQDYKKVYAMLGEINKKLFEPKRLYLMISPDLDLFVLYIVPPILQVSLQINNFVATRCCRDNNNNNNKCSRSSNSNNNVKECNRICSYEYKNRSKDEIIEISDIKVEDIINDYLNQGDKECDNSSNAI